MIRRLGVFIAATLLVACGQASAIHPVGAPLSGNNRTMAEQFAAGPNTPPGISWFPTPTQGSWPEFIRNGPDGNLWFTEFYADKVARITPQGVINEFSLPDLNDVESLVAGPDGNLWITEPGENKIGRMTTSGQFTAFQINAPNPSPRGICVGPDGNLWFAEFYDDHIGRITTSGVITRFALPTGSSPWEVIAGADGLIYITDSSTDQISRFNPVTLKFMSPIVLKPHDNPWGLTLGPDKHVWFTGRASGKIGVIVNGKAIEFRIGLNTAYPEDLAFGPDGNIYFPESQRNRIGRFDPATGTFLPQIILASTDIPESIVQGPDGNMWFTTASYTTAAKIGRLTP